MSKIDYEFPSAFPQYEKLYKMIKSYKENNNDYALKVKKELCSFYLEYRFSKEDKCKYQMDTGRMYYKVTELVGDDCLNLDIEEIINSVLSLFYFSVQEFLASHKFPPKLDTNLLFQEEKDVLLFFENMQRCDKKSNESSFTSDKLLKQYCISKYTGYGMYSDTIADWNNTLTTIKDKIKQYDQEVNYLGLSYAFRNLNIEKRREKWSSFVLVVTLALLTILIPSLLFLQYNNLINMFPALNQAYNNEQVQNNIAQILIHIAPVIAIEVFLIYFFRISLKVYLGIKSQMLQLKLRQNICGFVSHYEKLKNDTKDDPVKGKIISEQFEKLLFSPIALNDDKIPSTFEGLDQLAQFIKTCK